MKFAIRLLLISALAIGPVSCNRNNGPDQQVSANAPNDTYTERTVPSRDRQTTRQNTPPTNRDNRQATRPPEENRPGPAVPAVPAQHARAIETIPSGTAITVTLADTVSTETNKEGDSFTAHLSQ